MVHVHNFPHFPYGRTNEWYAGQRLWHPACGTLSDLCYHVQGVVTFLCIDHRAAGAGFIIFATALPGL
jgi:hypothetical protein